MVNLSEQRCALHKAHLSIYKKLTKALMQDNGIDKALEYLLKTCLDTANLSHGALFFIQDDKQIIIKKMINFSNNLSKNLEKFINNKKIKASLLTNPQIKNLSSLSVNNILLNKLLRKIKMNAIILAPLIYDSKNLGILLLASKKDEINSEEFILFTQDLTSQIGQTIALTKAIENISHSEQKNRAFMNQAFLNDKLATIGKLVAGVAHEINNPICWVMTNLGLIKEKITHISDLVKQMNGMHTQADTSNSLQSLESFFSKNNSQTIFNEFNQMIDETIQGVERVCDIVNNFKGFTRIDESELSLIDVHDTLDTALNMASLRFKYRAIFKKNYAQTCLVLANKGRLNQVFLNLIINAAQAVSESDPTKNIIQIETSIEKSMIRINIKDNGKGISPRDLPHIFEPFFTTKSENDGTGLGLAICHEIVAALKGRIEVKSVVKQGSVFSVYLPIAKFDESHTNTNRNSVMNGKKKILIIDDEPYLLNSLSKILLNNYAPSTALGGKSAIKLIANNTGMFDAIICDLQMPEMNGADFYHHVLDRYPELAKRIIFITGGLFTPSLKEFLSKISNTLLEKPFSKDDLLRSLENLGKT